MTGVYVKMHTPVSRQWCTVMGRGWVFEKHRTNADFECVKCLTYVTLHYVRRPVVPGNEIPQDVLLEMVAGISKVEGIARVMYDLTAKPFGIGCE